MAIIKPTENDANEFLAAIGYCITIWSSIEMTLYVILLNMIESHKLDAISAVFYTAVSFEQKLKMTNNAAKFTLTDDLLNIWKTLFNKLDRHSRTRNQIVHFQLTTDIAYENNGNTYEEIILRPHFFNAIVNLPRLVPRTFRVFPS